MGQITLGSADALTDLKGQAQEIIDKHLPLKWVIPEPQIYGQGYTPDFRPHNYSRPLELKPNQAYWPGGATRWAYGYLLMEKAQAELVPPNTSAQLVALGGRWTLSYVVYPLQAHQLLAEDPAGKSLWIVPWVCPRYWWQFQDVQLTITANSTWADVLDQIIGALPETITYPTIPAEFLRPSRTLADKRMNAAVLLDAVAQSLGMRLVHKWTGAYELESPAEAEAAHAASISIDQDYTVTDTASKPMARPTEVRLASDVSLMGLACPNRPQYHVSSPTTGSHQHADSEYTVQSTMHALWKTTSGPTPANELSLQALCDTITARWEGWRDRFFDFAWRGLQAWNPSGFDDFILQDYQTEEFEYEIEQPDTDNAAELVKKWRPTSRMRVRSYSAHYAYPYNYSIEADITPTHRGVLVKLDNDLLPGGSANAKIVSWSDGWDESHAVQVVDYDPIGSVDSIWGATCALTDEVIWAEIYRPPDSSDALTTCRPSSRHSHGLTRILRPAGTISPGGGGFGYIMRGETETGPQVAVVNYTDNDIQAGKNYAGLWVTTSGEWAVIAGSQEEPEDPPQMIQFSLNAALALTSANQVASVTATWNGDPVAGPVTVWNTCNEFFGPAGTCGVARWNDTNQRWQIIVLREQRARFIEFTVLTTFDKTDATINANTTQFYDGDNPGDPPIYNTGQSFQGEQGATGLARYDYYRQRYQAVFVEGVQLLDDRSLFIRFTANTQVDLGDTTFLATLTQRFNGTLPADGTNNITILNTCQQFRSTFAGACGLAVWNKILQQYECVLLYQQKARFIEFGSQAPVDKSDDSFSANFDAFYDGTFPGLSGTIWNTKNMFSHGTKLIGTARWDYERQRYQVIYAPPPVDALQWIEFKTAQTFTNNTPTVSVNLFATWNGVAPASPLTVNNTGGIFFGNVTNLHGVAAYSPSLKAWYIVQLECIAPASQSVYAGTEGGAGVAMFAAGEEPTPLPQAIPSYGAIPTPIPFEGFDHSAGDLITINASGEVEFLRNTRGAIRVQFEAFWDSQLGPSAADTSKIMLELNRGTGWVDTYAGISLTHVYQRIPPNNYIMGGTAARSYWSGEIMQDGWLLRAVAHTEGGTTITSLVDLALEILETYDTPLIS